MNIKFYGTAGEYAFLSNFYLHVQVVDGVEYKTNEHYFQACKAQDADERLRIIQAKTPASAKALGRRCKIVPGWDQLRDKVMERGLRAKFADSEMKRLLLATGDAKLIENSPRDSYWGAAGVGRNRLGQLLMLVRDTLPKDE